VFSLSRQPPPRCPPPRFYPVPVPGFPLIAFERGQSFPPSKLSLPPIFPVYSCVLHSAIGPLLVMRLISSTSIGSSDFFRCPREVENLGRSFLWFGSSFFFPTLVYSPRRLVCCACSLIGLFSSYVAPLLFPFFFFFYPPTVRALSIFPKTTHCESTIRFRSGNAELCSRPPPRCCFMCRFFLSPSAMRSLPSAPYRTFFSFLLPRYPFA